MLEDSAAFVVIGQDVAKRVTGIQNADTLRNFFSTIFLWECLMIDSDKRYLQQIQVHIDCTMGLLRPPIFGIGGCEGKCLTCAKRYLVKALAAENWS